MESPVPASMFAPEPSSPGAARAAAAAARLHGGFDSDCSEDGEALNGEPELDLTSKVGPGGGGGGARGTRAGRTVSEATAGSRSSSGSGSLVRGKDAARPPAALPDVRGPGPLSAPGSVQPASRALRSRLDRCPLAPPRGTGLSTPAARSASLSLCGPLRPPQEGSPKHWVFFFLERPGRPRVKVAWAGGGLLAKTGSHSEVDVGWQLLLFLVPGKETESSCSVCENDVRGVSTFRVHPNSIKRWD